jgi:serine/threonine-protein kinase
MKDFIKKPAVKKALYIFSGVFLFIMIVNYILMPWYVSSPEIKVPKVVGMQIADAMKVLEDNKLNPIVGDTVLDNRFPKNAVVSQRPFGDDVVKKGRRIYLIISGGEQTTAVPVLMGKSLVDAKLLLERAGLRIGDVSYIASTTPRDIIVSQEYSSGTQIRKNASVRVSISLGAVEGSIEVPNLVGKPRSEAEQILKGLQLEVGKISYLPTFKDLLPNTVVDQYPAAGAKVNPNNAVDLFISKFTETKEDEFNSKKP